MSRRAGAAHAAPGAQLQQRQANSDEGQNEISIVNNPPQAYQDATRPFYSSSHPSPFPPYPPATSTFARHRSSVTQASQPSILAVPLAVQQDQSSTQAVDNASSQPPQKPQRSPSQLDSADEYIGPARLAAKRERQHQKAQRQPVELRGLDNQHSYVSGAGIREIDREFPSIYPYNAHIYPPLSPSEYATEAEVKNCPPSSSTLPISAPFPWFSLVPPVKSAVLTLKQKQEIWPDAFPSKSSRRAAITVEPTQTSSPIVPGKGVKRRPVVTLAPVTGKRRRVLTPAQDKRSSSEFSTVSTDLSEDSSSASLDGRPRSQREKREYRGVALERRCLRMDRRKANYAAQTRQTPFLEADLPCLVSDYYSRRLAARQIRGYAAAVEGVTDIKGTGRSGSTGIVK